MRLLLDTHVLLWALIEPARLPANAMQALAAPEPAEEPPGVCAVLCGFFVSVGWK